MCPTLYCKKLLRIPALTLALGLGHWGSASANPEQHLEAAQAGSTEDMYALGQLYELGLGVKRDREQAIEWYLAAAQKGHPEASYQVGYAYYWGRGLPKNQGAAHSWFLNAAENGSRKAIPYLSKMYALGQGVPRDKQASQRWSDTLLRLQEQDHLEKLQEQEAAAAEQVKQTAPRPKAASRSTSPAVVAAPTKEQSSSFNEALVQRLLQAQWFQEGKPASHLPSLTTGCTANLNNISCLSKRLQGKIGQESYYYAIASTLADFAQGDRFSLKYQARFIAPVQLVDGSTQKALQDKVNGQTDDLTCELAGETIRCKGSAGQPYLFSTSSESPL